MVARGLRYDRRWMLVDENGMFFTQRKLPQLTQIHTRFEGDRVVAEAPNQRSIVLPTTSAERMSVQVWEDTVDALVADAATNAWFSQALGRTCRLVWMDEMSRRPVDPEYGKATDEVSFADGYPLLVTNETSLADLNARMAEPLPMNRFRPNVVVTGAEAWAEDRWSRLRIGDAWFEGVKPCARCVVTTTDQETGARAKEPLRTLATFRKYRNGVYFGQNLIPINEAVIRVGDPVEVLEHKTIFGIISPEPPRRSLDQASDV